MPVFYYRMKNAANPVRYLGPTAQDFRAAFSLGRNVEPLAPRLAMAQTGEEPHARS
jgi:hypothetical protein